jgi:2-polyprenyl-3-methyl-5-hydroxy-6-metoxy-1,4-benzoquinol methylase
MVLADLEKEGMGEGTTGSKTREVKKAFETPEWYLDGTRENITIRTETVQEFLEGGKFDHILDIACGDATASTPLLTRSNRLTLLDISSGMLAHAQSKIPANLQSNVEIINEDFMKATLEPKSFDLIICLGMLAHVDSPAAVIAKIASLLRPNGTIIMESTDAGNVMSYLTIFHQKLASIRKPVPYHVNLLTRAEVVRMFGNHGIELCSIFRYTFSLFPGIHRVLDQKALYKVVRGMFGSSKKNRNAWLGKECIYLFRPAKAAGESVS